VSFLFFLSLYELIFNNPCDVSFSFLVSLRLYLRISRKPHFLIHSGFSSSRSSLNPSPWPLFSRGFRYLRVSLSFFFFAVSKGSTCFSFFATCYRRGFSLVFFLVCLFCCDAVLISVGFFSDPSYLQECFRNSPFSGSLAVVSPFVAYISETLSLVLCSPPPFSGTFFFHDFFEDFRRFPVGFSDACRESSYFPRIALSFLSCVARTMIFLLYR